MNTKPYLTAILFFAIIFLSHFSGNAQKISDTISIVKDGFDTDYYQKGQKLDLGQLVDIVKENSVACSFIEKAYTLHVIGVVFDVAGGVYFGFSAGYAIGCAITGNLVNLKVLLPLLGASAGFIICGITCEIVSKNKIHRGVKLFNQSKKQSNNTNLDFGFSPNGVNLRLNF